MTPERTTSTQSTAARRDKKGPTWWQESTVGFFRFKIVKMSHDELSALRAEIKGALAMVQSQLESRGKTNIGWWKKASAAKGFMAEKQHILSGELKVRHQALSETTRQEKQTRNQARKELTQQARALLDEGDADGALSAVIAVLETFNSGED